MIVIRFADAGHEKKALGFLLGRFSFTTWANGDLLVPEAALGALAAQDLRFEIKGKPDYEQQVAALRGPVTATVQ